MITSCEAGAGETTPPDGGKASESSLMPPSASGFSKPMPNVFALLFGEEAGANSCASQEGCLHLCCLLDMVH